MGQMTDEWKSIPGYPGYEISESGQVKRTSTGKIIKWGFYGKSKAKAVELWNNGKRQKTTVQRLLCLAFHGEPPTPFSVAVVKYGSELHADNVYWDDLHRAGQQYANFGKYDLFHRLRLFENEIYQREAEAMIAIDDLEPQTRAWFIHNDRASEMAWVLRLIHDAFPELNEDKPSDS